MSVRTIAPWALMLVTSTVACDPPSPPPAPQPTASSTAPEPPREAPARGETRKRTVYVPAYSHLRKSKDKRNLYAITLSVRNIDPTSPITLSHVDYYDTSGHRVRRYLTKPTPLRPLETAEFFVEMSDDVGGSGANFLVYWEGPSDAHPLLTEAVMIGHVGAGYTAFTTRGVELSARPEVPEPAASAAPSGDEVFKDR
ncbi:MAG: DUF3124 domain-containing protein [Polyangiaceae bacterium]